MAENNPDKLLQTARLAAARGGEVLRGMWGQRLQVVAKDRFDFVTQADEASQEAVLQVIQEAFPTHRILAEESAGDFSGEAQRPGVLWVVDPLDGTTNYIHGIPQVAVSVAAMEQGKVLAGVVLDVARDEEFYAARGKGAWRDGEPIQVSQVEDLERSLLLTGFPFKQKDKLKQYLAVFSQMFDKVSAIRRPGAAALDLAWLASGRAEGFWEMGLMPWDVAAGVLLIEEAGGMLSDFGGGDDYIWCRQLVAGNKTLHPILQKACARHLLD